MKLWFCLALLLSVTAHSSPLILTAAPEPLLPTFVEWKSLWERSGGASEEALLGSWKLVGTTPKDLSKCGFGVKNAFNPKGVTTRSGGLSSLSFFWHPLPASNESVFAVSILTKDANDSFNQGPYRVDASEPQFSQFSYANGEASKNSFFEYSCRLNRLVEGQLICLSTFKAVIAKKLNRGARACLTNEAGLVTIYNKE